MKRIITLLALCSIGIALQGEASFCKATGLTYIPAEQCSKQCPSGCSEEPIILYGGNPVKR